MVQCNGTIFITTDCVLEIATDGDITTMMKMQLGSPIIDKELRILLEIIIQIALFTVTSVFGIMSNTVNITVYWKQGIKDSITAGLFALSVSDFFVVFFPLLTAGCYIVDYFYPDSPIHYVAVACVSSTQLRNLFYSLSCTLTAFLSIERCMCVIKPFKVKLIFTRRRTVFAIVAMLWFYVLSFVPIFFAYRLRWQSIQRRNFSSTLTLWYHPISDDVMAYHNGLLTIFVPTAAQVIVTCTAVIMIYGLRKSAQFRQTVKGAKTENTADDSEKAAVKNADNDTTIATTTTTLTKDGEKPQKEQQQVVVLDSRDARLVKTMVILVVILSIANIPYIAIEYTQLFVAEMNPGKRYQNLYRAFGACNILLGSLNASVNAFVYYYSGSRYRKIANDIFCGTKQ